jgi:hypothetical protein
VVAVQIFLIHSSRQTMRVMLRADTDLLHHSFDTDMLILRTLQAIKVQSLEDLDINFIAMLAGSSIRDVRPPAAAQRRSPGSSIGQLP